MDVGKINTNSPGKSSSRALSNRKHNKDFQEERQSKIFGCTSSNAKLLGLGNDTLLISLCDWQNFEEKVVTQPRLELPSFFLEQEINVEDWKNIPFPLVDAINIIKKALTNTENLVISVCKESKSRSETAAKKFKQLEKLTT